MAMALVKACTFNLEEQHPGLGFEKIFQNNLWKYVA